MENEQMQTVSELTEMAVKRENDSLSLEKQNKAGIQTAARVRSFWLQLKITSSMSSEELLELTKAYIATLADAGLIH